jgi:N-acetyl sugar amidotransferase
MEGITFDELGICNACNSSEDKMHIDWQARRFELETILTNAKDKSGTNYDCILPVSGGKDSFFQAHILTQVYGLTPLAVTFSHNWFTETGLYNLHLLLETFGLDHLQFTPARNTVNNLARQSLQRIGDSCWHCHAGVGAFPLKAAIAYNIPLLIWGESTNENDGRSSYSCPAFKFDRDYFTKVSAKLTADEMASDSVPLKSLNGFQLPSYAEIERTGVWGLHLGDYLFWDDERQTEFIIDHYGWKQSVMEGAYKQYKSVECIMSGMHDYSCYIKRGFGRATWQASVDVRNGLLTRPEAFKLIEEFERTEPDVMDYFLRQTGLSQDEFYEILLSQRHPDINDVEIPITNNNPEDRIDRVPYFQKLISESGVSRDF